MSQNYPAASPSSSDLQPVLNTSLITALEAYEEKTKYNLFTHPLTTQLQSCDSPPAILYVLQESAVQFSDPRGNEKLTNRLDPIVNVLHGFSSTIGQGVHIPVNLVFSGIGILLSLKPRTADRHATLSWDSHVLLDMFVRIEGFFNRLKLYTKAPPTAARTDVIVKIIIEILDILAIVTREMKKTRLKRSVRRVVRGRQPEDGIKDALNRLDTLPTEEARQAAAEIFSATHSVDQLLDKLRLWLSLPDPFVDRYMARRAHHRGIRRTLDEMPGTLDETFEQVLRGIDWQDWDYAHRLFQFLVIFKRPPRVEEVAETIFTFDTRLRPEHPEEFILSACPTLVAVVNNDGKRVVQFSHFSVREYLTSNRIANSDHVSRFWVDPPPAHALLARACLNILLRINRNNIQNFPLALYAAQYWADHARFANVSSDIKPAIECLFDRNKPHFATWLWLYDIDNPFAFPMTSVYAAQPYPVLYYAALCGFHSVAEVLVDAHSQDLNARSGTRGTALHAALDGGHQSVAMLLLERGADLGCLDSQGRTPLHIACRGCTDVVSALIDCGVDLNAVDNSRETPLHVASQWGRDDIIRLLLNHGAEVDHVDDGGWTALHVASHEGHDRIVQLLIDHGGVASRTDNGGWTPLHLASWEGQEKIVELLLDRGINENHPDNSGWTPLHAASQEGHKYCVKLLLRHGANPNYANSDGSTSLHVALQRNHHAIVALLLNHGADPNYADSDGSTLLHLASQRGQDNTVKLLLDHGADANRLDGDGWSSLHLASQRGHHDVVRLLLRFGVGVDANHVHSSGLTSLHLASQEGYEIVVWLLLYHRADVNSLNGDGLTPLRLASHGGHERTVRLLIEHGAVADHPNSGFTEGVAERTPPRGSATATRIRRRV